MVVKAFLQRAARAFGPREAVARARCVVAEAEIALGCHLGGTRLRSLRPRSQAAPRRFEAATNCSAAVRTDASRWSASATNAPASAKAFG